MASGQSVASAEASDPPSTGPSSDAGSTTAAAKDSSKGTAKKGPKKPKKSKKDPGSVGSSASGVAGSDSSSGGADSKPADASAGTDTAGASPTKPDTPKAETPAAETPTAETPATETPAAEVPAAEAPKPETPATETPAAEVPAAETPEAETPATEAPAVEIPAAEVPAVEAPAAEVPAVETPVVETPATEAPAEEVSAGEAPATAAAAKSDTIDKAGMSAELATTPIAATLDTPTPAPLAKAAAFSTLAVAAPTATATATKPTLAEQIQQLLTGITLPEYPNVPGTTPAMVAGAVVIGLVNAIGAALAGGVTAPLAIPLLGLLIPAYQRFVTLGTNHLPVAQVVSTGQTLGIAHGTIKVTDPDGDPFSVTLDPTAGATKGLVTLTPDLLNPGNYSYTYSTTDLTMLAHGGTDSFTIVLDDTAGIQAHPLGPHVTTQVVNISYVGAGNHAPTGGFALGTADLIGVFRGKVNGVDFDSDPLTYSLANSSNPAGATSTSTSTAGGGIVTLQSDGSFTYIPKNNGLVAPVSDSFVVTVSDGYGGSTDVSIPILAPNLLVGGKTTATNAGTGAVDGKLGQTVLGYVVGDIPEQDKNLLTYAVGSGPAHGSVVVRDDGTYTYTPTAAARHAAAGSGPDEDTFSIVGVDAAGRTVKVADVTVDISPQNTAPGGASVNITNVNSSNGTVTGTITGTDADGDPLTFSSGSIVTPNTVVGWTGNLNINSNGTFTYTINALTGDVARHTAAKDNATDAEKYDTVTVQMADGYGGVTDVQVKVPIAPKNTNPNLTAGVKIKPGKTSNWSSVFATDADLDSLTWTVTKAPTNGTVQLNPSLSSIDYTSNGGGIFTSGPADSFEVTITDGHGGSFTRTFTY